jgi:peroxidase
VYFAGTTRSAGTCTVYKGLPYKRQQFNAITAYIDASNVYGSDSQTANSLRELDPNIGDLKIGNLSEAGKPYLPFDYADESCLSEPDGPITPCFKAGDVRANEQIGLTAMHTIWMREHNRVAAKLRQFHPKLDGDAIYQEARKIVGAKHQVCNSLTSQPPRLEASHPIDGSPQKSQQSVRTPLSTVLYKC